LVKEKTASAYVQGDHELLGFSTTRGGNRKENHRRNGADDGKEEPIIAFATAVKFIKDKKARQKGKAGRRRRRKGGGD